MTNNIDWNLIRTFLCIFRSGSCARAATELGVDESTVRRRLTQLERIIGSRIFERRDGLLVLAEDHAEIVDHALRMEASANQFWSIGQTGQVFGAVRISLIDLFAIELGPDIANFSNRHPEILLDITTEPHIVDLRRDGIDIAIRMARPTQGEEILRRLGRIGFGIYGSREYFASASGLDRHKIIALGVHYPHSNHEFTLADHQWMGELGQIGTVTIMADCYPAMLKLCQAGAGLAALPHYLTNKCDGMIRYEAERFNLEVDIWALVRPEVVNLPKIRKTIEFLAQIVKERIS